MSEHPATRDLAGWFSWANAGALLAIQDGYRQATGRNAVGAAGEAAAAWSAFFSTFPGEQGREIADKERLRLWGLAEQAGADYGAATAYDHVSPSGRQQQFINAVFKFGNDYRGWLINGAPATGLSPAVTREQMVGSGYDPQVTCDVCGGRHLTYRLAWLAYWWVPAL